MGAKLIRLSSAIHNIIRRYQMLTVFIRTLIMYFTLVIAVRLTGKRQIGELQVSELVVTYMLSELAVFPITDKNAPLFHSVVPIIVLLSLEVIFSFIQTKSIRFRKLFSGGPTLLISKGKLNAAELAKNRIDLEELLGELRLKGAFDIADVEYAFLEENGQLSVLLKASSSPFTPDQLDITVTEKGCAHAVVVDGEINRAGLVSALKTERWLEALLKKENITADDVFLMTVDDAGCSTVMVRDKSDKQKIIKQITIAKESQKEKSK